MAGTPPGADLGTSPAADLAGNLRQARELAHRLDHALAEIHSSKYHRADPSGLVEATVDGAGTLTEVTVTGRAVRDLDAARLDTACLQAVTAAYQALDDTTTGLTRLATATASEPDQPGPAVPADLPDQLPTELLAELPGPQLVRHIADALSAGVAAGELSPVRRHAIDTLRAATDLADTRPATDHQGSAADGAVTATVAGPRQVTEIRLDPTLRHRLDNVALGEAVRDAVSAAQQHAADAVADTVRQLGLRPSAPLADRPLPDILRGTS